MRARDSEISRSAKVDRGKNLSYERIRPEINKTSMNGKMLYNNTSIYVCKIMYNLYRKKMLLNQLNISNSIECS